MFKYIVIALTMLGIFLFVISPLIIYNNLTYAERTEFFPLRNPSFTYYYIETCLLKGLSILFIGFWIL